MKSTFAFVWFQSTGDGEDYLALALRDGAVTLNINLGSGKLDVQIRPPKVRFDDNQWHRVRIMRKAQEVCSLIDWLTDDCMMLTLKR